MIRNGLNKIKKFWGNRWWLGRRVQFSELPVKQEQPSRLHRLNVPRNVRVARLERKRHIKHMRRQKINRRGG